MDGESSLRHELSGTLRPWLLNEDPVALKMHQRSMPNIPVVKWTLGKSHVRTLDVIDEHLTKTTLGRGRL